MKNYNEIKKEFVERNYSIPQLTKSIIGFFIVRFLFTELFFFLISTIPFIIGFCILTSIYGFIELVAIFYLFIHLLFYIFYVKKVYNKEVLSTLEECNMIIKALKEIKNSKKS